MRGPSVEWLARRGVAAIGTIGVASVAVFLLFNLLPDPAYLFTGMRADEVTITNVREFLGLDLPLHQRFINFYRRLLTLDLRSYYGGVPVVQVVLQKLPITLGLVALALMFSLVIALALCAFGLGSRPAAVAIETSASFLTAVPAFIPAVFLMAVSTQFAPQVPKLVPAALSLALVPGVLAGELLRVKIAGLRAAPYTTYARALGIDGVRLYRRLLREGAGASITVMGNASVFLLAGGAAIAEFVFGIPGVGSWLLVSAARLDLPVLFALVLGFAIAASVISMLAEVAAALADPRLRG